MDKFNQAVNRGIEIVQSFDKKKHDSLIKESKDYFIFSEWMVEDIHAKLFDYSIKKGGIKCVVECVDRSIIQYKNFANTLDYLEGRSNSFSEFGLPSLVILHQAFDAHDYSYIVSRGILAISVSRLEMLEVLPSLKMPNSLSPFEELFARRSFSLATTFSQNCEKAGKLKEAIDWGEIAVVAGPQAIGGHHRLIKLLRDQGNMQQAKDACLNGLRRNPNATSLLNTMQELVGEVGDTKEIERWKRYQDERPSTGSAAELLLSGQPIPSASKPQSFIKDQAKFSKSSGIMRKIFSALVNRSS